MDKAYKIPLQSAPKYKPTGKALLQPIFFCDFKREHPQHKGIPNNVLGNIIKTFNGLIPETVCEFREGVELPENLGVIIAGACKKKDEYIDRGKSAKAGKVIVNRNWNTDGFIVKIFFINRLYRHNYKHKELWKFEGCKDFRKKISTAFLANWKRFIHANGMTGMFRQASIHEKQAKLKRATA